MLEGSSVFYCKTFPGCCEVVEACWHHQSGVFLRTVEKSGVWLITLLMTMLSFKELVMLLSCIMRHFISFSSCFHSLPCFFSRLGSCPVFLFCFCFPALCSPDLLMAFLSGLACQRYSPLFLLTSLAIIHLDCAPGPFQSPLTPAFPVSDEWKRSDFPPGC